MGLWGDVKQSFVVGKDVSKMADVVDPPRGMKRYI